MIVIQDLKTAKKSIETKIKKFQYEQLKQKGKFPRFLSFQIPSIPKIENSEILENDLLNFGSLKSKRIRYGSRRKKLSRFPSF